MDLKKESICYVRSWLLRLSPSQMLPPCGCNHLTHYADINNVHNINNLTLKTSILIDWFTRIRKQYAAVRARWSAWMGYLYLPDLCLGRIKLWNRKTTVRLNLWFWIVHWIRSKTFVQWLSSYWHLLLFITTSNIILMKSLLPLLNFTSLTLHKILLCKR